MRRAVLPLLLTLIVTAPATAHHSAAQFILAQSVTVDGVVARYEWANPHVYIYVTETNAAGETVEWEIEMMSLNHLRSYGWVRTTVKAGDVVAATGAPAKSGAPSMIAGVVELPDGRKIRS